MRDSLRWHEAAFRTILRFYPPQLRRQFGEELVEVFRQQMDDARAFGLAGIVRTWFLLIMELPDILLQAVRWQFVAALALSLATASAGLWCLIAGTGIGPLSAMTP